MSAPSNAVLEQICLEVATATNALGTVMVLLHRGNRVEVLASLREEVPDLGELLQTLANQVKDGDYLPIGGDLGRPGPNQLP